MHDPVMGDKYTPAVGNDGNFIANVNDDDGAILDSLVSSEAEPPERDELPIVRIDMRPVPTKAIPPIKSMVARTITVAPNTPYQLARANPWRESIHVEAGLNNTSTSNVFYGPSATDVLNPLTRFGFYYTIYDDTRFMYNGDMWIYHMHTDVVTFSILEIITQEVGR